MTPDGKHVVSGSYDKTIKVWNLDTGKEERTLEGHSQRGFRFLGLLSHPG